MVPAGSPRISRVLGYSGCHWAAPWSRLRGCHPLRPAFPGGSASSACARLVVLLPRRRRDAGGLGCSAFARHYSRNHCYFLFLRVLRCFSSPGWLAGSTGMPPSGGGLPHSDIRGSKAICASPRLFAAYRVLLRLREPRHPPCALLRFSWGCPLPAGCRMGRLCGSVFCSFFSFCFNMSKICVENNGFEPLTPCLQSRCSSQLS